MKSNYSCSNIKAILLLNLLWFAGSTIGIGQSSITYFLDLPHIPPSPMSSSLVKFSHIPVGLSTGIPDISFPLGTLEGHSTTVPITLAYHASGIKVNELPGWVGLGWSLHAGGVITRFMHGLPDELTSGYLDKGKILPDPTNDPQVLNNWTVQDDTLGYFAEGIWDGQPDEFTYIFNGHQGDFVFGFNDQNSAEIYTIPHKKYSITWDDSGDIDQFIIITDDGLKYSFGKSLDGNRTAIETAEIAFDCGDALIRNFNSAWYLMDIVSPFSSDTIKFYYSSDNLDLDYKQADYHFYIVNEERSPCYSCEDFDIPCESEINYSFCYLDSIVSATGSYIFHKASANRLDEPDLPQLDSISVHNLYGGRIGSYWFDYSYLNPSGSSLEKRLQLDQFYRLGLYGDALPSTEFEYNTDLSLPARGSYNQDLWGYFNNINNDSANDTTFVADSRIISERPFGAKRESDSAAVLAGLINKITLPTGGSLDYSFSINDIGYNKDQDFEELYTISSETKTGFWFNVASSNGTHYAFTLNDTQSIDLDYYIVNETGAGECMGLAAVTIRDENDDMLWVPSENIFETYPDCYVIGEDSITLPPGTYVAWGRATCEECGAGISVIYDYYEVGRNRQPSGTAIKTVTAKDNQGSSDDLVTEYVYKSDPDSTKSSGSLNSFRPFNYYYFDYDIQSGVPCDYLVIEGRNNTYSGLQKGGIVSYDNVIVRQDGDENNGYVRYDLNSSVDSPDSEKKKFPFVPPEKSLSWARGTQSATVVVDSNNLIRAISGQTMYHATDSGTAYMKMIPGIRAGYYSFDRDSISFNMYTHLSSWSRQDSSYSITYSDNNNDSIQTNTSYIYENPDHLNATRIKTWDSHGDSMVTKIMYPADYSDNTGDDEATAITKMKNDYNIQNIPVEVVYYQQNQVTGGKISMFKEGNNKIQKTKALQLESLDPISSGSFTTSNTTSGFNYDAHYKPAIFYSSYDSYGHLETSYRADDSETSALYGYEGAYAVATILNAEIDDVAYTSFECSNTGGWTYSQADVVSDENSLSGNHKFRVSTSQKVSKSSLNTGKYILTFWAKDSVTVNVSGSCSRSYKTSGHEAFSSWIYYEYEINVTGSPNTVELSRSLETDLDEVRLYPIDARMTTTTYKPGFGPMSITDQNNITTYYEYDQFGRLIRTRDQNKNLIRQTNYNITK